MNLEEGEDFGDHNELGVFVALLNQFLGPGVIHVGPPINLEDVESSASSDEFDDEDDEDGVLLQADKEASLLVKCKAARSVSINLKSLETLSKEALFKGLPSVPLRQQFAKLPVVLMSSLVEFLLEVKKQASLRPMKLPSIFFERMMNANLQIFDLSLIEDCPIEKKVKIWKMLLKRCPSSLVTLIDSPLKRSPSFYSGPSIQAVPFKVSMYKMKQLAKFTNLQNLSLGNIFFECNQFCKFPQAFPKLRSLETILKCSNLCCVDTLLEMKNLEKVAITHKDHCRQFCAMMFTSCLNGLPNLKVIALNLIDEIYPCLLNSLTEFPIPKDKPLKLKDLGISISSDQARKLPSHLLPDVARLRIFSADPIPLDCAMRRLQPFLKLENVSNLTLRNLPAKSILMVTEKMGAGLRELIVRCGRNDPLDLYLLLSHCPYLQMVQIDCPIDVGNKTGAKLGKDQFANCKWLELFVYGEQVPEEILKMIVEAEHLGSFFCNFASINLIQSVLHAALMSESKVFKELEFFSVCLVNDDPTIVFEEALKMIVLGAPKLKQLDLNLETLTAMRQFRRLRVKRFLNQFKNLLVLKERRFLGF